MATKKNRRSALGLGNLLEVLSQGTFGPTPTNQLRFCVLAATLDAPRYLALAVRDALVPKTSTAAVDVWPLGVQLDAIDEAPDAAVVIPGASATDCAEAARHMAGLGVPTCLVVPSAVDAPELGLGDAAAALVGVVAASDASVLPRKLSSWLSRSLGEKCVALAAAFPFCRQAVVDGLALRCALENAALGAVSLVPGSDFPLMTTNQAKLAVQMSSCYGASLSPRRAAELAGVVGAGRLLLRPLRGRPAAGHRKPARAGIAFGGTMATARGVRPASRVVALRAAQRGRSLGARAPLRWSRGTLPTPSEAAGEQPVQYLQIEPDGKARS